MGKKKETDIAEVTVSKWTKAQLLMSNRYKHQKDILNAVLKDGEKYTVDQVDDKIHKYMKGGAN